MGEDIATHSATLSETHLFSGATSNVLRAGFFRNAFDTDKPLNKTSPRELGFNYDSTLAAASGPPFLIVSGYASVGDPITGPRDTKQNTYERARFALARCRRAQFQIRRRVPAHPDQHVGGHRLERLLRVRAISGQ